MRTRNYEIKLRLNENEYKRLNELVKDSKRSRESYLRSLIDGIVPFNNIEQLNENLLELRHIGNNLNQIARVANTHQLINSDEYMINVANLYKEIANIKTLLAKGIPLLIEGERNGDN